MSGQFHAPATLTLGDEPRYPSNTRLGGPHSRSGHCREKCIVHFKTEPLLASCMGIWYSLDSLITRIRAGKLRDRGSISRRVYRFFFFECVETGSGIQRSSYSWDTKGSIHGGITAEAWSCTSTPLTPPPCVYRDFTFTILHVAYSHLATKHERDENAWPTKL